MRLALGTAQFGFPYGVANIEGQVSETDAKEIINFCRQVGIDTLDTAIAYGDSELCIGKAGIKDFKVVTKLPSLPDDCKDINQWVTDEFNSSLTRLKVTSVHSLMLHNSNDLLGIHGLKLLQALLALKNDGLVRKIGVSVYSPDEFEALFNIYTFEIIQCPFNIIDNRLISSGWMNKLKLLGVEIHVRSCFLQGLLLMQRDEIPNKFNIWNPLWDDWHEWLEKNMTSSLEASIGYVISHNSIDKIVIGVDSKHQLNEIVMSAKNIKLSSFPSISSNDIRLINPSNWSFL